MTPRPSPDAPVLSIALRKAVMVFCAALALGGFIPVLLQYKGLIDVESFGVPENYFYIAGFAASFVGLISVFIVWRCPGCGRYLGKEASPSRCPSCGAKFG